MINEHSRCSDVNRCINYSERQNKFDFHYN